MGSKGRLVAVADIQAAQKFDLRVDGALVATYCVDPHEARPYVDLLTGPDGQRVTRSSVLDELPEESRDHPHHRGIWWGHRDVGEADFWTEFDGHGRIEHVAYDTPSLEPFGVSHRLRWVDREGSVRLTERRVLRALPLGPDGERVLDLETTLEAPLPIAMRDTKEAGLVAVRVAASMEERRGGRIENAEGQVGESECWGRPAAWCDYSGQVDGEVVGIAVFDHPANPRYPTTWHVRDYGLMAANPFGYSDFSPEEGRDGTLWLEPGNPVHFRYRILVHRGNAVTARLAAEAERFAHTEPTIVGGP
jgi:hypothetical protein